MLINKNGEVLQYCCPDMQWQFDEYIDLFEENYEFSDLEKEHEVHFFFSKEAKEVNLPVYEWMKSHNGDKKFCLSDSYYVIHYCPFCGEKIEVVE